MDPPTTPTHQHNILVTGAAGFIGSHTVLELLNAGYDVTAIDNFSNSIGVDGKAISLARVSELSGKPINFKKCDLLDSEQLEKLFLEHKFDAAIHFAALKSVAESVAKPLDYYRNNIVGSLNLIECCTKHGVKHFVFSSSATVYGDPKELPMRESAETGQKITNTYGQTKAMIEQILMDVSRAEPGWSICILRYFNPVGAHPSGCIGEDPQGIPNNLMPYVAQVASGRLPVLTIYGDKYDTPDGTGVRDYIHVMDLARAHVSALDRLLKNGGEKTNGRDNSGVEIYNLGTGKGQSVKEMVTAFEKACGKKLNTRVADPRPGDLAVVYCDPTLANEKLGWKAQHGIDEMCRDMWNWTVKNPKGYAS